MKIDNIKVKSRDKIGARVLEIQTPKCHFRTPERIVTSTESNYKVTAAGGGKLNLPLYFENPVFERIKTRYTVNKIKNLLKENHEIRREIIELRKIARDYDDQIRIFYPKISSEVYKTGLVGSDLIRVLVDLQLHSKCYDFITIPDYHNYENLKTFGKNVLEMRRYVENNWGGFEVMPYIDIKQPYEAFSGKLNVLISNGFRVIGFIHGSVNSYYHNYLEINGFWEKEVWFHMSDVSRYVASSYRTVAGVHIPQIYGVDTYSIGTIPFFPREESGEASAIPIDSIKRYDPDTLGALTINEHKKIHGSDLLCNCPLCNGKNIDNFYEDYSKDNEGELRPEYLRCCSNLHEAFSSTNEFQKGREYILEGDFTDYLTKKEYLLSIDRVKERVSQTSLAKFL